jgi:ribosomal protein L6P/L9E
MNKTLYPPTVLPITQRKFKKRLFFYFPGKIGETSLLMAPTTHVYITRKQLSFKILTKRLKRGVNGLYLYLFESIIAESCSGFGIGLTVIGVGYNIQILANMLLFNVGASILLVKEITEGHDLVVRVSGRKNTEVDFFGISRRGVMMFVQSVLRLRETNIYTGKGIAYQTHKRKLKMGKVRKI